MMNKFKAAAIKILEESNQPLHYKAGFRKRYTEDRWKNTRSIHECTTHHRDQCKRGTGHFY